MKSDSSLKKRYFLLGTPCINRRGDIASLISKRGLSQPHMSESISSSRTLESQLQFLWMPSPHSVDVEFVYSPFTIFNYQTLIAAIPPQNPAQRKISFLYFFDVHFRNESCYTYVPLSPPSLLPLRFITFPLKN